jgi:hypothetical protein
MHTYKNVSLILTYYCSISIQIYKANNYNKYYIIKCHCNLNNVQIINKCEIEQISAFVCF